MYVFKYAIKPEILRKTGMYVSPIVHYGPFESFDEASEFVEDFVTKPERYEFMEIVPYTGKEGIVLDPYKRKFRRKD